MLAQLTKLCAIPLFILCFCEVMGQKSVNHREPVELLSPKGTDISQPGSAMFRQTGNVKFRHQGVLLFCDQAIYQATANRIEAIGHVLIVQGDTIIIKADTLVYEGASRQAFLRGRVTFQDRRVILNATQLDYITTTGVAHYANRGRLVDSRNVLTSREGYYDTRSRQIELQYAVRLVSPDNTLTTDLLIYNITSRLASILAPTRIMGKDGVSVAQQGQYDTQSGLLQQSGITGPLKYAKTDDSLDRTTVPQSFLSKSSLSILTQADQPILTSPSNVSVLTPVSTKIALTKTATKPTANSKSILPDTKKKPLEALVSQKDTTTYAVNGTSAQQPNVAGIRPAKDAAKAPIMAKRQPVKSAEPVSVVTIPVPARQPDEQVALATADAGKVIGEKQAGQLALPALGTVLMPTTQPEIPVRLTGLTFLKPKSLAVNSSGRLLVSATYRKVVPLPPVKQTDTTYIAVVTTASPALAAETVPQTIIKKPASTVVHLPAKRIPPVESATVVVPVKKPVGSVPTAIANAPKPVLPEPSVRQVANAQSGSISTFQPAVVDPPKRTATARRTVTDPQESDLERELNRRKHFN